MRHIIVFRNPLHRHGLQGDILILELLVRVTSPVLSTVGRLCNTFRYAWVGLNLKFLVAERELFSISYRNVVDSEGGISLLTAIKTINLPVV